MKKIVLVLSAVLLLVSCSSRKENAAFERYMNDLFIEATHVPIEEFDFEIMEKESMDYTTAQENLFKLSQTVCNFDREYLMRITMLGGDDAEVNGAVKSMIDSYEELENYSTSIAAVCKLDADSAMELYNSHRTKVGIIVSTIREELGAIAQGSIFLRPFSFVEDTMLYENDYGCTRESYIRMDTRLSEMELNLDALPEEMKRVSMNRVGTATRFQYTMKVDDLKKVYSTFAVYDAQADSIVYVQEDELPVGLLIRMGFKSLFD